MSGVSTSGSSGARLSLPTPMAVTACGYCAQPTPRTVPLGPVYCSGTCWTAALRNAEQRQENTP